MAEKRKIFRKTATGAEEVLYKGFAEATDVSYDDTTSELGQSTVQGAIDSIASQLDGITGGGVVTGVKGSAESNYRKGDVNITKENIGLGNADNTSDANKPVSTAQKAALDLKEDKANLKALAYKESLSNTDVGLGNVTNDAQVKRSEMGVASGVATLDTTGKVPSSQLPSYVDDVLEFANKAAFPTTGESGKIYVAQDTNLTYRWGGTDYTEISASLALGETESTAYAGNKGKANADAIAALQTKTSEHDTAIADVKMTAEGAGADALAAQEAAETAQETADDAKSKAESANNAISAILDGTSVVNKAETANKLATERAIDINSPDIEASTVALFDGSKDITLAPTLTKTGIPAGTYSVLTVDAKGRATAGGQIIEFGTAGQTTPSASLAVGGLFFELVE